MDKKYLAKIIATDNEGLQMVSACTTGAKVKVNDIKYLASNKVFLLSNDKQLLLSLDKIRNIELCDNFLWLNNYSKAFLLNLEDKNTNTIADQSYSERQLFEKAYDRLESELEVVLKVSSEDAKKKMNKALGREEKLLDSP